MIKQYLWIWLDHLDQHTYIDIIMDKFIYKCFKTIKLRYR